MFLGVEQRSPINTELEAAANTLKEARKIVDFGGATPQSVSGGNLGGCSAKGPYNQPSGVWISAAHML
jgi:hypothetical protein